MEEIERNHSMDQADITQLPDNCMCQILEWLDLISDWESFGLTCRRWIFIQNSSGRSLWFYLPSAQLSQHSLSQTSMTINTSRISQLLNRFCKLELSSLSSCAKLPFYGLAQLKIHGFKMQTLELDFCFGIAGDGFSLVALSCPLLTVNSLSPCNGSDIGSKILAKFYSALKVVDLLFYSLVSDDVIIIKALTNERGLLRSVRITNCPNITGVGFRGCSQTLSYLEANYCKLELEGILGFVCGGGPEYLSLSNINWISKGVGLAAIGARSTDWFRILDFRYCRTIGDDSVLAIAKGSPVLEEWNIGVAGFEERVQWLAILYISWCARIRPEAILDV